MSDNIVSYFLEANKKIQVLVVAILILLVLPFFIWLWWVRVYQSPLNTFWGMVENNYATTALTKNVSLTSTTAKLQQTIEFHLGPAAFAHAKTVFTQAGSQVVTEEINTPTKDYVRYTKLTSTQTGADGKPLNFSSLTNTWGESNTDSLTSTNASQLFNQTLLGILPTVNLTTLQRKNILKQIHTDNVYQIDTSKVKSSSQNGHQVYVYQLQVDQMGYVKLSNALVKDLGIHNISTANPADFANAPKLTFLVSADKSSRNLLELDYPGNQHKEIYTSYNIQPTTQPKYPTKTIPLNQLKQSLINIANQAH